MLPVKNRERYKTTFIIVMNINIPILLQPLVYQRQGAESALVALAKHFGPNLFASLPQLWTSATHSLSTLPPVPSTPDQGLLFVYI
jgi:hypothetical protein